VFLLAGRVGGDLHTAGDTPPAKPEPLSPPPWLLPRGGKIRGPGTLLNIMRVHGLINYKDTKTKCRLYWLLTEFIDWRYSRSCWYFRPSFVNYCVSNLLSASPPLHHPPPLPFPKSKYRIYRHCVAGREWEGGGC
jgi:hypothetical protein